jgi:hypothetical protein
VCPCHHIIHSIPPARDTLGMTSFAIIFLLCTFVLQSHLGGKIH